jgi:hypothetical protein
LTVYAKLLKPFGFVNMHPPKKNREKKDGRKTFTDI